MKWTYIKYFWIIKFVDCFLFFIHLFVNLTIGNLALIVYLYYEYTIQLATSIFLSTISLKLRNCYRVNEFHCLLSWGLLLEQWLLACFCLGVRVKIFELTNAQSLAIIVAIEAHTPRWCHMRWVEIARMEQTKPKSVLPWPWLRNSLKPVEMWDAFHNKVNVGLNHSLNFTMWRRAMYRKSAETPSHYLRLFWWGPSRWHPQEMVDLSPIGNRFKQQTINRRAYHEQVHLQFQVLYKMRTRIWTNLPHNRRHKQQNRKYFLLQ